MIINSINIISNIKQTNNNNYRFLPYLKNDVFVKNTSFGKANTELVNDKSFKEFERWATEHNFIENINKVFEDYGNIIGSGFEGTTYNIPDCDNWILKRFKRCEMLPIKHDKGEIIEIEDRTPKLNVGQMVARVEIPCGQNYSSVYYILKKQDGKSYGVPYDEATCIDVYNTNKHLQSLKTLSEFPQSSFDKCIKDIKYISDAGYEFDTANPNNVMIDDENKSINFVDINDIYNGKGTHYGEVLFSLIGGCFAVNFLNSDADDEDKAEALKYTNKIINKYIKSMRAEGVKFTNGMCFNKLLESPILNTLTKEVDSEGRSEVLKMMGLMR